MPKLAAVALVAVVSGCGPSLVGAWAGSLTVSESCAGGAPVVTTEQHSWTVVDDGNSSHVELGLGCDPIGLDASGDFVQKLCPVEATAGGSETPAVVIGSLGIGGAAALGLSVEVIDVGGNHYCARDYAGTLSRQ